MAEFKTGTVRANQINFHFLEMGEGPLVLCMHGFPDNAYTYRYLLPELARAGFRAVAPFMRGYAPTEAPKDGRYEAALLGQDALCLIDALDAGRAALVGHDWGAFAVYCAAALGPEKVTKLVMMGTAPQGAGEYMNMRFLKGVWHHFYFQMPDAERTLAYNDFAFIEDFLRDLSPGWDIPREILESIKETFRKPGVLEASIGYYRQNFNPGLQDPALKDLQGRATTSPIRVPTLALHGDQDRPGGLEAFAKMDRFFMGGLEKVVVPDTGHHLHLEKPKEVNRRIVEFLKG